MDPKRILLVNEWGGAAGGTETYVHNVAAGLTRRGFEVGLLYAKRARPPLPCERSALCPGLSMQGSKETARDQVRRMAAEFRPDLVHVNRLSEWEPVSWLSSEFPTVAFMHDHFPVACPGFGKFLKTAEDTCSRKVGPYCAIAPWVQNCGSRRPWVHLPRYAIAGKSHGGDSRLKRYLVASRYMKGELTLNGVPESQVAVVGLPGPSPWGRPGGGEGILYVGRLTADKGVRILVEAVGKMERKPALTIVGEGPMRAELQDSAKRLGLEADFTGWLEGEALRDAFESTAIVVVPSLWPEPFGLVGLEAMAAGRPIVGFDRGGIKEWLADGENGKLVAKADAPTLAKALTEMMKDATQRARLGQTGLERVAAHFSQEAHLDRLVAQYRLAAH